MKPIIWLITALPHHLISRVFYFISRLPFHFFQRHLILWYIKQFDINLEDVSNQDLSSYKHLNAFFVRQLRPDARPINNDDAGFVSPVDGKVSQAGRIQHSTLFQAKNHDYDLVALLGNKNLSAPFIDGHFVTIYLSPRDYHRIHMPVDGDLTDMLHIPGRLFSVSPFSVKHVKRLFARNERVVCLFDTPAGKMALVLVGAINVAAIETVWEGMITPPKGKTITHKHYDSTVSLSAGEEMGRFNMGSTVILLTEKESVEWVPDTQSTETALNMGQRIGQIAERVIPGQPSD